MKIFLDEQLPRLAPLLRFADYDVVTVVDEGFKEHKDEKLVNHAKVKDYIFVNEDEGVAKLARDRCAPSFMIIKIIE
jgi:predicted nuclease of predicted toxin-antitoxin system